MTSTNETTRLPPGERLNQHHALVHQHHNNGPLQNRISNSAFRGRRVHHASTFNARGITHPRSESSSVTTVVQQKLDEIPKNLSGPANKKARRANNRRVRKEQERLKAAQLANGMQNLSLGQPHTESSTRDNSRDHSRERVAQAQITQTHPLPRQPTPDSGASETTSASTSSMSVNSRASQDLIRENSQLRHLVDNLYQDIQVREQNYRILYDKYQGLKQAAQENDTQHRAYELQLKQLIQNAKHQLMSRKVVARPAPGFIQHGSSDYSRQD